MQLKFRCDYLFHTDILHQYVCEVKRGSKVYLRRFLPSPKGVWVSTPLFDEGERILAAGGTHALVPTYRLAVLGNILTAPQARGQGYATAITATLVTTLFEQHFSTVVLNVFEDNSSAIRIYQRLGFQT